MRKICLLACVLMLAACEKKSVANKIIDPIPVSTVQAPPVAQMAQAWFLLQRDCMVMLVPVINRTSISGATYKELTGPDSSSQYTFMTSNSHYGSVTFTIQFRDVSNNVIDPISNIGSTATVQSVVVSASGNPSRFSFTLNSVVRLDVVGDVTSAKFVTGSTIFNGQGNSLSITFDGTGATTTFEGLTDGSATGTGTDANGAPTHLAMRFYAEHTMNGSVQWEDQEGGLHFDDNGSGFIVTDTYRLLLD